MLDQIAKDLETFRKTSSKKNYPKPIKKKIIELLESGTSIKEVAESTGIHQTTLLGWKKFKAKSNRANFQKALIVDDGADIKVTIISGLKLSDLSKILH